MDDMTAKRFEQCLDAIGWSSRAVAIRLGVPETRPRYWAAGRYPVPKEVARWLERLAAAHEKNPPPETA
jgi:hypothetical protein